MVDSDHRPQIPNWLMSSGLCVLVGPKFQWKFQQTAVCGTFPLLPANACHASLTLRHRRALPTRQGLKTDRRLTSAVAFAVAVKA